jgi:protein phosphatase PTC6
MESVNRDSIPPVLEWIQTLGGYFKRFRGGALAPWLEDPSADVPFDLDIRATLAFLQASRSNTWSVIVTLTYP